MTILSPACLLASLALAAMPAAPPTLNRKDDGYRGIWYMNQPTKDEFAYKYSGGLGTYCAHHQPFALYSQEANKMFFCYGGTSPNTHTQLWHMVACFDHATGKVPRPTLLLDKATDDAHDNPVISIDTSGHLWIFSTSHGTSRPSVIHRSKRPGDVSEFARIEPTWTWDGRVEPLDNFSYFQIWPSPGGGFHAFLTRYKAPAARTTFFVRTPDGIRWDAPVRLGAIHEGHYQCSATSPTKSATAFNYHPAKKGLNWRTNLYYLETRDAGRSWQTASGKPIQPPLTNPDNPALVVDYASQGLNVYLADVLFDSTGQPVITYVTSRGFEPGPKNQPRVTRTARWTGESWEVRDIAPADHNYDMGSLFIERDGDGELWRFIGPTDPGPQPWGGGGEINLWESRDRGASWKRVRAITTRSPRNHNYVRRPLSAHRDFYALWADGDPLRPSESRLYFCDRDGNAFALPDKMHSDWQSPAPLRP